MIKRVLSLIICIVMMFTVIPISSSAENESAAYNGLIVGGGFETTDEIPTITNLRTDTVEHVTDITYGESAGAIKVGLSGFRTKRVLSLSAEVISGTKLERDMEGMYKASIKLKAASGTVASVYFCFQQNGSMLIGDDYKTAQYAAGTATEGVELSTKWTEYQSAYVYVNQGKITLYLFITGTGTVWIDELDLLIDPEFVPDINRLKSFGDFEDGVVPDPWSSLNEEGEVREIIYDEETDSKVLHMGRHEPSIRPNADGGNLFLVSGHKPLDPKGTYRLQFDVKTVGLTDPNAFGVMILQWWADPETGKSGNGWLKVYGLEKFMTMTGDNDWTTQSINISGFRDDMTSFTMYFRLEGHGDVYIDNVLFTLKDNVPDVAVETGECGDTAQWTYKTNQTLNIAGSGSCQNYKLSTLTPWYNYSDSIAEIVIEEEISYVGNYSFYSLNNLEKITVNNPDMTFGDYYVFPENSKLTICSAGGGAVEAYAKANNFTFVKLQNPVLPDSPTLEELSASRVLLKAVEGYEYSSDGEVWQESPEFEGLDSGTNYSFYQRIAENEYYAPSNPSAALSVTTDSRLENNSVPNAPELLKRSSNRIILKEFSGYEYSADGETWQRSNEFSGLSPETEYTFHQRIAQTEKYSASVSSEPLIISTLAQTPSPSILYVDSRTVTLTPTDGFEYKYSDTEWQSSNVFENVPVNKILYFYQRSIENETDDAVACDDSKKCLLVTAPDVQLVGKTNLILTENPLYEYCLDDFIWQDSNTFEMLVPNETYTAYQRPKALENTDVYYIEDSTTIQIYGAESVETEPDSSSLVKLRQELLQGRKNQYYDYNGDMHVNVKDLVSLKKLLAENSSSGDIDDNQGTVTNKPGFGGETFTMTIVGSVSAIEMRRKEAFEKKYNCKIKLVSLQWEAFNSQIATAMASGQPYDICGLASAHYPNCVIQGLYEPLNDYIYEEDLYNEKTGIGIDMANSRLFEFNGRLYGVSDHTVYAPSLQVLYYNKMLFENAALDDPLTLWKQGRWDWDAFEEIGRAVTNPSKGKYLMGQEFNFTTWVLSSGFNYLKTENGKVKHNIQDKAYLDALNRAKSIYDKYVGPKGYSDNPTEFYNGNYYMFGQAYSYGQYCMYDSIVASSAFENDYSNLGVVPFPTIPGAKTKVYPAHGGQAKSAGKGSGAQKLVVAWTKFASEFEDPERENDPTYYSDEIYKALDVAFNNINVSMPNYNTATNSASSLTSEIEAEARKGGDISKAISERSSTIQYIIDAVLRQ